MDPIKVDQARERVSQLETERGALTVLVGQLRAENPDDPQIIGTQMELNRVIADLQATKDSVGLRWAVWKCNWNGNTYLPERVVSRLFNSFDEANSERQASWMLKDKIGKIQHSVFTTIREGEKDYLLY